MHDSGEFMSTSKWICIPRKSIVLRLAAKSSFCRAGPRPSTSPTPSIPTWGPLRRGQDQRPYRAAQVGVRNGDVVEILTQYRPSSQQRLAGVGETPARNKIRHVINATERAKPSRSARSIWKRSPPLRVPTSRLTESQRSRRLGIWLLKDRGSSRGVGLWKIFSAPDFAKARARSDAGRTAAHWLPRSATGGTPADGDETWSLKSKALTTYWSIGRSVAIPFAGSHRGHVLGERVSPCTR